MEIWFYHLTRRTLEATLPTLLERSLQRGWKAVVQAASEERVAALDDLLWTYADDSFLAHGVARDGDGALQPIYLTAGLENPNAAAIRFFVEGAEVAPLLEAPDAAAYERFVVLFDGADPDRLDAARAQWKLLKEQGRDLSYWRQSDEGRWEKVA